MRSASLSRRSLLRGSGLALLAAATPRLALAAAPVENRFVLVILRGALDGLAAVPPHGDPAYAAARGGLALPGPDTADGVLDLDGFFGLNRALSPLLPLWRAKEMAVVHAVASPYRSRSHFDGQNVVETGAARANGARDGWLNRTLLAIGGKAPDGRLGLAVGQGVPFVFQGAAPVGSWAPPAMKELDEDFLRLVLAMYREDPLLHRGLEEGLRVRGMAEAALPAEDRMAGRRAGAAAALVGAARVAGEMLAAADGPRLAVMEASGWDTHAGQGTVQGPLANRLGRLADALIALKDGLGPAWRRTTVAVVTEFGRTVAQNGTRGTDHGTASVALLLGGAVDGGRVLGTWPGLAEGRLHQGRDLAPTTDLRAVLKGVLAGQYGLAAAALDDRVFPGSGDAPALRGLVRA